MPGLVQNGRKRPSIALSDDEDGEQSDFPSSVSVGSKRARGLHTRDASGSPSRTNGNVNDMLADDVFKPGTLVRVKLRNFVTYTAAEFHLGPSLNMVIGPNGTGKSTLVCAICLGLGWSSEHLGRAKELGQFVKNGSDEAVIEIELAAGPGMAKNRIVRRLIQKSNNKTSFWIDGKTSSKNAVLALCKEFSIQIDNLCQFLPQDRVVEFAKMSDVDRLRETQRAAAPQHMVEWHDQLKGLRGEEKALEIKHQNEQSHLEKLQLAQGRDQQDVDRYHQREGLLQKSKCLEKVRPIIELRLRKEASAQAKEALRTARRELDQINANVEPVRQAQAETEAYKDQIDNVVKLRKNRVDMIKTQADRLFAKIDKEKQAVAGFVAEVKGEVATKRTREQDIARMNAEIQRLERQRQEEPVNYDMAEFTSRKNDLGAQYRALDGRRTQFKATAQESKTRGEAVHVEYKRLLEQRKLLDTQSGKQASVLQRLSSDTAKAWAWFQENKSTLTLKGEVYGPPILECSVKDLRYADVVESQMRKGDFIAITCTHAEDQQLLSKHFFDKDGLRLHDIFTRTSPRSLSEYRPPVAPVELERMGFEGYIIDYVDGPDAVLAMLCDNSRLHKIAHSSRPLSNAQHDSVSGSAIQKWVSGKDVYQITTRKEYDASSTAVTKLRPAQNFVDQPANSDEKLQLDEAIKTIMQNAAELSEQRRQGKEDIERLSEEMAVLRQERDNLQIDYDRMRKALAEWQALPGKIQQKQALVDEKAREIAETSNRIRDIKANSQQASLAAATFTLEYAVRTLSLLAFGHR